MARYIPQDLSPSLILNMGFDGYTHLLLAKRVAPMTVIGVYRTARLANAAKTKVILQFAGVIPVDDEFPVLEVYSLRDAWRKISLGRDPQWLEWLVDGLLSTVNTYGVEGPLARTLALKLSREHRTIQQSTLRTLQMALVQYLALEPGTDLRNEAAVNWAKAVAAIPVAMPHI